MKTLKLYQHIIHNKEHYSNEILNIAYQYEKLMNIKKHTLPIRKFIHKNKNTILAHLIIPKSKSNISLYTTRLKKYTTELLKYFPQYSIKDCKEAILIYFKQSSICDELKLLNFQLHNLNSLIHATP